MMKADISDVLVSFSHVRLYVRWTRTDRNPPHVELRSLSVSTRYWSVNKSKLSDFVYAVQWRFVEIRQDVTSLRLYVYFSYISLYKYVRKDCRGRRELRSINITIDEKTDNWLKKESTTERVEYSEIFGRSKDNLRVSTVLRRCPFQVHDKPDIQYYWTSHPRSKSLTEYRVTRSNDGRLSRRVTCFMSTLNILILRWSTWFRVMLEKSFQ